MSLFIILALFGGLVISMVRCLRLAEERNEAINSKHLAEAHEQAKINKLEHEKQELYTCCSMQVALYIRIFHEHQRVVEAHNKLIAYTQVNEDFKSKLGIEKWEERNKITLTNILIKDERRYFTELYRTKTNKANLKKDEK